MKHPFSKAQWIWNGGDPFPPNYHLAARKHFSLRSVPAQALLHISADSRYVLYVNGARVGQGPNRCWPFDQQYDTHDVADLLVTGKNVIAILAIQFGVSTYSYCPGRGGLLCQLEMWSAGGRKRIVASDKTWRVTRHTGWQRPTPRAALQLAWAEHFDAREDLEGWTEAEFDDAAWGKAVEIGPAGTEPWTEMSPREIPFLTEDEVYPARVMNARVVRAPQHNFDANLQAHIPPGEIGDPIVALLAVTIVAPKNCEAKLRPYNRLRLRDAAVNGQPVARDEDDISLSLAKGENLLVIDSGTTRTYGMLTFAVDSETPLEVRNPLADDAETPLAVHVGTGGEDAAGLVKRALAATGVEELAQAVGELTVLPADDFSPDAVGCQTQWATALEVAAKLDDPQAMCAANREVTTIHPARSGDVEVTLDFGSEVFGWLELEIDAPEGATLDLYGFEAFVDGHPHWTQIEDNVRYTAREGKQFFHSVAARGLRYLIVTARDFDEPINVRMIRCLFSSTPTPATGAFRCSDDRLNRIYDMCAHTMRCCMSDTFVDCPLYEQALWVGDARNEALISYACFGSYEFAKRNWRLAAQSMFRSPVVESRVPSGSPGVIPAWAMLWIIGCEETYLHDGDLEFLREMFPHVARCLRSFMDMRNEQGLMFMHTWNFLDWAPMDTPADAVVAHQNMWLVKALRTGARMAELVGKQEEVEPFGRAAEELTAAINEHLFSYDQQVYLDCIRADGSPSPVVSQQTHTVAYLCDVVPERQLSRVARLIADPPDEWVTAGSPFAMFFVMEALAKLGRHDLIVDWTREYWGEMLDAGATTAWEMLHETRSYCHAWSAGPAYFLPSYQLGVRPLLPGFEKASIAPVPVDLDWCEGRMPTPHGEIAVRWELSEERFEIEVDLPAGVRADLVLPVGSDEFAWPQSEGEGVMSIAGQDGRWVVHLDDGARVQVETHRVGNGR